MDTHNYNSVIEAITDLQKQGYTYEFVLDGANECVVCHQKELSLSADDFQIDTVYRFDAQSDPDEETIVYAVSSKKHLIKGIIINAFGIYGDANANSLVEKLKINMTQKSKPIKRNTALVKFSQEHHFGLLLCWKIREGIKHNLNAKRIADYVLFFFDNDLQYHFAEEENKLFSKLNDDDVLKQRALKEHNEVYGMIKKFGSENVTHELLNEFAELLDNHIRFEERTLFNHIQEKLSSEELTELLKKKQSKNEDVDKRWTDCFWEKK